MGKASHVFSIDCTYSKIGIRATITNSITYTLFEKQGRVYPEGESQTKVVAKSEAQAKAVA
jgi:hypothetical protein